MEISLRTVFLCLSVFLMNSCYLNEKGEIVRHLFPPDGVYERAIGTASDSPTRDFPRWWGDLVPLGTGILLMDTEGGTITVRITECVSVPCENIEAPSPAVLRRLTSVDGMHFTIEQKTVIERANRTVPIDALALRWGAERLLPTAEALDAEWQEGP